MSFIPFGLDAALLKGIAEMGFERPTPIQEQTIPAGMEGRDLLAAAMTGSGKTAAFVLPILHRLLGKTRGITRVLILTPTRELAAQIEQHIQDLGKFTKVTSATVFGGVAQGPQERAMRSGVDIVVATPGRLLDILRSTDIRFDKLDTLVIDEADRMLDMGFLPDVRRVLSQLPRKRQTLFFSATMPPEIQRLSKELLVDPVAFNVERKSAPATGITQVVYPVPAQLKSALLLELLRRETIGSVIVFTRTKHRTNRLSEYLEKHGVRNARMHGNRSQSQRTQALADFKDGTIRVLCATDIVARGIDVEQLEHVVNFDVPHVPEDYIHRVGRTARADAVGEAFTFVSGEEEHDMAAIERAISRKLPRVQLDGFDYSLRHVEALEIPIAQRLAEMRAQRNGNRGNGGNGDRNRNNAPQQRRGPSSGPSGQRSSSGQGQGFGSSGFSSSSYNTSGPGSSSGGGGNNPPPRADSFAPRNSDAVEVAPGIWRSSGNDRRR